TIHFARLETVAGDPGAAEGMEERTLGYLDSLSAATRSLSALHPDVVALAHTGVSYLTGYASEPALVERLQGLAGTRAFTTARARTRPFAPRAAARLPRGTPYPEVIATAGRAYWEAAGFEIVAHHRLDGVANIYEEPEERAYTLGRAADAGDADAVLI